MGGGVLASYLIFTKCRGCGRFLRGWEWTILEGQRRTKQRDTVWFQATVMLRSIVIVTKEISVQSFDLIYSFGRYTKIIFYHQFRQ